MRPDTEQIVNLLKHAIYFDDLDSLIQTLEMMLKVSKRTRREIKVLTQKNK